MGRHTYGVIHIDMVFFMANNCPHSSTMERRTTVISMRGREGSVCFYNFLRACPCYVYFVKEISVKEGCGRVILHTPKSEYVISNTSNYIQSQWMLHTLNVIVTRYVHDCNIIDIKKDILKYNIEPMSINSFELRPGVSNIKNPISKGQMFYYQRHT